MEKVLKIILKKFLKVLKEKHDILIDINTTKDINFPKLTVRFNELLIDISARISFPVELTANSYSYIKGLRQAKALLKKTDKPGELAQTQSMTRLKPQ